MGIARPTIGDSEPECEAHDISYISLEEFTIQMVYALHCML